MGDENKQATETSDTTVRGVTKVMGTTEPRIIFCNKGFISVPENDEFIQFAFACDQIIIERFALTPKHAKRFKLLLDKTLEEYEKRNGELKTELPKEDDL